jgi:hypothetical protein
VSDSTDARPVSPRLAMVVAIVVALGAGYIALKAGVVRTSLRPDIDQLWFAAGALLEGRNPYDLVGPGRAFDYGWPLLYPLPAILPFVPLASFPVEVSRVVMAAFPAAVLAYFIAKTDARNLVLFLSYAFYGNAWYAQWTPLLLLIWYVPWMSVFLAAKPTAGLLMLCGVRGIDRRLLLGLAAALAVTILSVLLLPRWPVDWLAAVRSVDHIRPWIVIPGGLVLLLALSKWRHWEGRFLVAFALVPQTPHPLATLPLVLLPRTIFGKATIAALTYLPTFLILREPFGPRLLDMTESQRFALTGSLTLWCVVIPTLLFVLLLPKAEVTKSTSDNIRSPQ